MWAGGRPAVGLFVVFVIFVANPPSLHPWLNPRPVLEQEVTEATETRLFVTLAVFCDVPGTAYPPQQSPVFTEDRKGHEGGATDQPDFLGGAFDFAQGGSLCSLWPIPRPDPKPIPSSAALSPNLFFRLLSFLSANPQPSGSLRPERSRRACHVSLGLSPSYGEQEQNQVGPGSEQGRAPRLDSVIRSAP
jgi:hypothetical protein